MCSDKLIAADTSGQWDFTFFTGGVKCEVIRNEELVLCDEAFEGSASVRLISENIVKASRISDKIFKFVF